MNRIIQILQPLNNRPAGENWYTLGQLFGYGDEQLRIFQKESPRDPIKELIMNCDSEKLTKLDKNLRLIDANSLAEKISYSSQRSVSAPVLRRVNSMNNCTICMDNLINTVAIPCGHMCICTDCSTLVNSCPICRLDKIRFIKVYKA